MKIRISVWTGKEMNVLREVQIKFFSEILDNIKWMDYNVHQGGEFKLVPETEEEQDIINFLSKGGSLKCTQMS